MARPWTRSSITGALLSEDVETLVDLRLAFLAEVSGASESDPVLRESLTEYFSG